MKLSKSPSSTVMLVGVDGVIDCLDTWDGTDIDLFRVEGFDTRLI